jgi:methyl-accepting chemotaxis protein
MNQRPSTSIFALAQQMSSENGSASSLRGRFFVIASVASIVLLGAIAYGGTFMLKETMAGDEDARILSAASLSKQLVERVLAERSRQVDLIASAPSTIAASRKGAESSRQNGLTKMENPAIEAMFKVTRSQQVDGGAKAFLTDLLPKLDIAEVMVTDEYGFNAVTTSPSSDFVQSDEGWWQTAWTAGVTTAQATFDPATQRTVVELASAIRDGATKVGVVKVKFGLSVVDSVLAQGGGTPGSALRVDLVDTAGRIIASSVASTRFKPFPRFDTLAKQSQSAVFAHPGDSTVERATFVWANGNKWRVVARMREADASRAYSIARWSLLGGVGVMLALILGLLALAGRFIQRRITGPATELAVAAEAVADGDLSKQVNDIGGNDEIGRLARAVSAMIAELRRLATALNVSANEQATMTAEINASSEEMAASAGQIAHTASDLSGQANSMASTIQHLASSSEQLVSVAQTLDAGAREGVERNMRLRSLALENRARLDDSARSLGTLTIDVEASAAAIDQLAHASEEVRTFVTLVQKLARQSKLLALNAAMEAARAGEHGHGFAVVAEEVRRLAAMSSDAAERTELVVGRVLHGITQSRTSSERTVDTVRSVRDATEQGSRSFGQIEHAVAEAEGWTSSIERAATSTSALSQELRASLDSLASGTESFAAAMEEVAASSQEQSASTEQIAAAAGTLAGAAERLGKLVANLRLEGGAPLATMELPIPVLNRRMPELGLAGPRSVANANA